MAHKHSVYDTDAHFSINPFTRAIKNESTSKVAVIQHDHNSERFTFEIPRLVDGHDMSVCDRVEVHYINMDSANKDNISADIYEVDDLQVSPDDRNFVICSWLLSQNATKYAGSLNFLVRFVCLDGGKVAYAWHTAVFTGISVSSGILNNAEEIVEPYVDVLAQWKADLFGVGDTEEQRLLTVSAEQQAAIAAKGALVLESIPEEYTALNQNVEGNAAKIRGLASAIKGSMSGEIVRADDVSPVEHTPVVKVHGKNLFDISKISQMTPSASAYVSEVGNDYIVVTTPEGYVSNGYCTISRPLKEFCPRLQVGKIYTFNAVTESYSNNVYLPKVGKSWVFGQPMVMTEDILNSSLTFYGLSAQHNQGVGNCLISNIQVEEGTVATDYEPYIDPSTVKVSRCGKNFWHSRDLSYPRTVSGVTINYDPVSQIYTFNGTSTSPGDIYTVPNGDDIMHINAGETWTLKVEVMGGTVDGVATCSGKMSPLVNTTGYTNTIHANTEALYVTKTYTEAADITKMYFYVYASGIVFNNFKCRIQFEPNSKPTAFEKFKDLSEYIPAADGTVSGMTSLSPHMTVLTDTDGAIVECEYNIDTKTYIDNKIAEALKGSEQA